MIDNPRWTMAVDFLTVVIYACYGVQQTQITWIYSLKLSKFNWKDLIYKIETMAYHSIKAKIKP